MPGQGPDHAPQGWRGPDHAPQGWRGQAESADHCAYCSLPQGPGEQGTWLQVLSYGQLSCPASASCQLSAVSCLMVSCKLSAVWWPAVASVSCQLSDDQLSAVSCLMASCQLSSVRYQLTAVWWPALMSSMCPSPAWWEVETAPGATWASSSSQSSQEGRLLLLATYWKVCIPLS